MPKRRSPQERALEQKISDVISALEAKIGIQFLDKDLLREAITHRSFPNESPIKGVRHNERLEFLGDAVLECAVSEYLVRNHRDIDEGKLTLMRSSLVRNDALASIAEDMQLSEYLLVSRGQQHSFAQKGKERRRLLACALEALIGAMHLDRGFGMAELFCLEFILPRLQEHARNNDWQDPKSYLQILVQEKYQITPHYEVTKESGPDHDKMFYVRAMIGKMNIGEGKGPSKKEAEQSAAEHALKNFFGIDFSQKE